MRLLELELSGFGAFARRLYLDFTKLSADALFLIHGPTGAGKTTILDGICFALFDQASAANERQPKQLRSDFAASTDDTFARLKFELKGKKYQILRQPPYLRPAKRGDGMTEQLAKVSLELLSDNGRPELMAGKKSEADQIIKEMLGVDVNQFRQTALLPQGQFRNLLAANSDEREKIMASLFRLEHLKNFEKFLKTQERELAVQLRGLRAAQSEVLESHGFADAEALSGAIASLLAGLPELDVRVATAKVKFELAQASKDQAKKNNELLQALYNARFEHEKLSQQAAEQGQQRDILEAAKRANQCDIPLARLESLEKALRDNRQHIKAKQISLFERENSAKQLAASKSSLAASAANIMAELNRDAEQSKRLVEDSTDRLAAAEQSWRAARAAVLAEQLEQGMPCPVCGALDHPNLASSGNGRIGDKEIDALRDTLENQRAAAEKSARAYLDFAARLREWRLDTGSPSPALLDRLSAQAFEKKWREFQSHSDQSSQKIANVRNNLEVLISQGRDLEDEVDAARSELQMAIISAGFNDFEGMSAARRSHAWQRETDQTIRAFERMKSESETRLRDASAAAQELEGLIDLEPLTMRLKSAQQHWQAAIEARKAAKTKLDDLEIASRHYAKRQGEIIELDERYANVGHLANLANGSGDGPKISFQSFVLSAYLDEALDAASQRLRKMSKGRYDLRRTGDPASRRQRTGLDLEVDDAHSGRSRPVKTLSGGESFQAALALALGMMDVVRNRSGGIQLDIMFIDEGFGSLDPEALDQAIETLIDLRSQGRMIGIISHVPELKERIDLRLEVKPGRNGSTANFVLP